MSCNVIPARVTAQAGGRRRPPGLMPNGAMIDDVIAVGETHHVGEAPPDGGEERRLGAVEADGA